MTGRTTKRESPLQSTNILISSAMPSQHTSRFSPAEGYSIARQVMDDAVTFYLENGGPAVARKHVENLAKELIIYDDCTEAYREAMARISTAEEVERQRKAQYEQEISELMKTMIEQMPTVQQPTHPAFHKARQKVAVTETGTTELPPKLSTEKAMRIWKVLQEAGYIDEHYQPIRLSRTMKACLANEIIMRLSSETEKLLGFTEKWKPFEQLWHMKDMKSDYYKATAQENIVKFKKVLDLLFANIDESPT